ncbi:MAG: hypothetical protein KGL50_10890, partial [Burkholderiales bacterium]|nr:hypothetical protein [Burkholderiales bacterium]
RPGEGDPEAAPAPGLVGRAARGLTGAMGQAARQAARKAMGLAVDTAVAQVTARRTAAAPRASAPTRRRRAG